MSGFSSHGDGAGLCANADVVSAPSAAAIKRVLVEDLVIVHAPSNRFEKSSASHRCFEQITNAIVPSIRRVFSPQFTLDDFVIPRIRLRDYLPLSV
jgi:hypothetical protein